MLRRAPIPGITGLGASGLRLFVENYPMGDSSKITLAKAGHKVVARDRRMGELNG